MVSATDLSRLTNTVSALTGNNSSSNTTASAAGVIEQTERLLTTRPRSAAASVKNGGDRGERAYIKVLTTDTASSLVRTTTMEGFSNTSLGDSNSGVLSDAVNSTAKYGGYASFLLMNVQTTFSEKMQIVETFGDSEVVYYFGRAPLMFNFSGLLIDSIDNNWFVQWLEMYGAVMRGTQLARNYELLKIVLPNMEIIGTMSSMSYNQSSERDTDIQFQFQFLAKQVMPKPVVATGAIMSNEAQVLSSLSSTGFVSQSEINSVKNASAYLTSIVSNPLSTLSGISSALSTFTNLTGVSGGALSRATGEIFGGSGSGISTTQSGGIFSSVGSNLTGVRASMFSPVYGVLGSLAKLIRTTTGSVNSILTSFTSPVQNILRDVRNVSNQAVGIVNLLNNSVDSVTGTVRSFDNSIQYTLATLKNTAGVISTSPETITQSLRRLVNAGRLSSTTGFLKNSSKASLSSGNSTSFGKLALLNSGPRYTPQRGAYL